LKCILKWDKGMRYLFVWLVIVTNYWSRVRLEKLITAIYSRSHKNLWNFKFHYRDHKSPPLVPIQSQLNQAHIAPCYFSKTHFIIILVPTSRSSKWSLSSEFPTRVLYAFRFSPCVLHALSSSCFFRVTILKQTKVR
jgi:hypothetical protein